MDHFALILSSDGKEQSISELVQSNEYTKKYGLTLSPQDAAALVQARSNSLRRMGRVEFGGGVLEKLIRQFCDSPYIIQSNYEQTMEELLETFYYLKNESLEQIGDDDLMMLMKYYFDHNSGGCIELLQGRDLEELAHNIRYGNETPEQLDSDRRYEWNEEEYGEYEE